MSSFSFRLQELADIVGGELVGDPEVEIRGVAGIREAKSGDITFVANPRYEEYLEATGASAVIARARHDCVKSLIQIDNPYFAYLKVLNLFAERRAITYARGVDDSAVVSEDAELAEDVCIGPLCHVAAGAKIGRGTTLVSGVYIGEDVTIGEDCLFYSHVSVREGSEIGNRVILQPGAVIGADGFGYAKEDGTNHKVPQIGRVIIEDDVEIGANSTVDRATTGETRIRRGCKIDNLVQVAHNVVIDEDTVVAAQAGISGSAEIGAGVVIGGQAGLVGHIAIGDGARLGAQAGVTKDVPAHTTVSGYPAREHVLARKIYAHTARLPELFRRVKELEQLVARLEKGELVDPSAKND